jgi:hypothetical protein
VLAEHVIVCTAPNHNAVDNIGGVKSLEALMWAAYKWQDEWAARSAGREWATEDFVAFLMAQSGGRVVDWVKRCIVRLLDELGMVHPKLFQALMLLFAMYNVRVHVESAGDFHQLLSIVERRHEGRVVMSVWW